MSISKEEVLHIAELASLKLSEEEALKYTKDIQDILEMANRINEVNTDNITETVGTNGNFNVFRKDEIKNSISRDEILKNAPSHEDGMFKLPKVIQ
jgi:aspartyl-tRNA(Asn)/glutamyl-tRNA(Gln) amidotransferase subunit C